MSVTDCGVVAVAYKGFAIYNDWSACKIVNQSIQSGLDNSYVNGPHFSVTPSFMLSESLAVGIARISSGMFTNQKKLSMLYGSSILVESHKSALHPASGHNIPSWNYPLSRTFVEDKPKSFVEMLNSTMYILPAYAIWDSRATTSKLNVSSTNETKVGCGSNSLYIESKMTNV